MRQSILAPLCSAIVLPGLGQILNRQFAKGLILVAMITILFLAILVKLMLDISAVMGEVIGPDLTFGPSKLALLVSKLRARDMTVLYLFVGGAVVVWAFSIFDAYLVGRRYQPPSGEEPLQA